jgi:hypothetical protein
LMLVNAPEGGKERFARLFQRPGRGLGGPSARAASGGNQCLPWLLLSVVPRSCP